MLQSLFIQNYALIDTLDICFDSGFSVITGETGAGKSIILGAIGLLLGQRADSKSIKKGASRCIVEAHFKISHYEMHDFFESNDLPYEKVCIIRREIMSTGKSRAFINDTPASLNQIKQLGEMLIDIHSQHQNLLLNTENFQFRVVDIIAQDSSLLHRYQNQFAIYKKCCKALDDMIAQTEKSKAEEDYIRFQLEQFSNINLRDGEQEELEQEFKLLSHAEEIKSGLYKADHYLVNDEGGILSDLKETQNLLQDLSGMFSVCEELSTRVHSCFIELKDIEQELNRYSEDVEFNPQRLDFVEGRLNQIYTLQQKYRVNTIAELIAIEKNYRKSLEDILNADNQITELTRQKEEEEQKLVCLADELNKARKLASQKIETEIKKYLVLLGIPNVQFLIELTPRKDLDRLGGDNINFLFSANKSAPIQNITQVASGGEIARVMLSIKAMITSVVKLPTIIFDEIDTGVSGHIAEQMARIMQEMGNQNRQVISITHLPQIAARGRYHYKVYKQDNEMETTSHIRLLSGEERIVELAHMLSGATLTEAAINNAKSLLNS